MDIVDLCDAAYQIRRGVNAVAAIREAMENGAAASEHWLDGLLFVVDKLDDEATRLEQMVETARPGGEAHP